MYLNKFADIGEGLHEGKVGAVYVKDGDKVKEGDPLFSIETDKVTSDITSPVDGVIKKTLISEGETIHVGDVTHHIDDGSGDAVPQSAPKKEEAAPIASAPKSVAPAIEQPSEGSFKVEKAITSFDYDAVVIGTGPGGYVMVELLGDAGMKVAAIEKEYVGGVCLNVGCIPTKALLKSAKIRHYLSEAARYGVDIDEKYAKLNWANMQKRKQEVVSSLVKGVESIIKRVKAELIKGEAQIIDPNTISVSGRMIKTKYIIIASGSRPIELGLPGFDDARAKGVIINSTGALNLETIPKSFAVVGGGVIGVEFATLMKDLGSDVTIVEGLPTILGPSDGEVKKFAFKMLTDKGIKVYTSSKVQSYEKGELIFETENGKKSIKADKILVSVGRRANNLNVDKIGVELKKDGSIKVNERMQTNIPNIYAIGDVINEVMLAHAAYKHAHIAAEAIISNKEVKHSRLEIPSCIYTHPEISSVGYTEEELKDKGIEYVKGIWQNTFLGKALADGETDGFAKILIGAKYGEVLGAHIINGSSSDMISEIALAMKLESTIFELQSTIHPHPSTSEAIYEAATIAKKAFLKLKNK